ncbi:MAG TPA: hypothetical protein VNS55_07865 [Nocardioides sp.]|nr:hypothetical protein [Nocardioides sp.]
MKTITSAVVGATTIGIAAAALATTVPSTSASGAAADGTTLTFRLAAKDAEDKSIDIGPKGDSVGDRNLAAITLKADGEVAGRLQAECTTLDRTYEGHLCQVVVFLDGGSLTLQSGGVNKPIPNIDGRDGDVFAVTGGTGAYVDAGGELRVSDDGRTVTIALTA